MANYFSHPLTLPALRQFPSHSKMSVCDGHHLFCGSWTLNFWEHWPGSTSHKIEAHDHWKCRMGTFCWHHILVFNFVGLCVTGLLGTFICNFYLLASLVRITQGTYPIKLNKVKHFFSAVVGFGLFHALQIYFNTFIKA